MSELLNFSLQFENDWTDEKLDKMLAPLINSAHTYLCEWGGCGQKATIEWMARDDDGDIYYSMRCDSHPVKSNEYHPKEV